MTPTDMFELFKPLPYEKHTRMIHPQMISMNNKTFKDKPIPVTFVPRGDNRFTLKYPFSMAMNDRVKQMSKFKYHGFDPVPAKEWSVKNDMRTGFVVRYWEQSPDNPYAWYKQPVNQINYMRPDLYKAQREMIDFIMAKRYAYWACEMGLGKTLSAMHANELIRPIGDTWWVAPKSAGRAVRLEQKKWEVNLNIEYLTYQGLTKRCKQFDPDDTPPQVVVFDEAHNIKNGKAARSQAAHWITQQVKDFWGPDGMVIVMTGTPAPKEPVNWYWPVEVLCPGFLAEGNSDLFRRRLSAYREEQFASGIKVDKTLGWLDDGIKCKVCGQPPQDICHPFDHDYIKSENEVAKLRKRLEPIVLVQMKKDYLDLPEKRYEIIRLKPDVEMKRWASLLAARANSAIQSLILLRELSDGFLYEQVENGTKECPVCKGTKSEVAYKRSDEVDYDMIECPDCAGLDPDCIICEGDGFIQKQGTPTGEYERIERDCRNCKGTGRIPTYDRKTRSLRCPKDDAVKDLLERYQESGRFVTYAAFEGTIDRMVALSLKQGWDVMRIDGRGIIGFKADGTNWDYGDPLEVFQQDKVEKINAVMNPEAGGVGITLTRAHAACYVSNSYKAHARLQSEDRIHRLGMDINKGATYYDLVHLPQDQAVLDVLKSNRDLQTLSMIELERLLKETDSE